MTDIKITPMLTSGNVPENWKMRIQKFKNYLIASETEQKSEKTQCAQLLLYLGDDEKIDVLITKFQDHFVKTNLDNEICNFFPNRRSNESVEQLVTDMKNMTKQCGHQTEVMYHKSLSNAAFMHNFQIITCIVYLVLRHIPVKFISPLLQQ